MAATSRRGCRRSEGLRGRGGFAERFWHFYAGEEGARGPWVARAPPRSWSRGPSSLEGEPSAALLLLFFQTLVLSRREKVRSLSKLPERLACLDFSSPRKGDKYLDWGAFWESWGEEGQVARGRF